ncbi:MAG: YcxB family protein [Sediminibacterium sp.]
MSFTLQFQKSAVLQALRYHFIKQSEIKTLLVIVNVYAIATAILLYYKKIRPELFLLGSVLWIVLMLLFWYILPWWFYRKTPLFKYDWQFSFDQKGANLVCQQGEAAWEWSEVKHYFESPAFFHFYFGPKSFFIIPKEPFSFEEQHEIRGFLK